VPLCVHRIVSLRLAVLSHMTSVFAWHIQGDSRELSRIWEVIGSADVSKDIHMNMSLILNGYRETVV
jgi:hypothetical protein